MMIGFVECDAIEIGKVYELIETDGIREVSEGKDKLMNPRERGRYGVISKDSYSVELRRVGNDSEIIRVNKTDILYGFAIMVRVEAGDTAAQSPITFKN